MAVFRGGKGYGVARRQLRSGDYPVSWGNDNSVLWGQRAFGAVTGASVLKRNHGWQQGDYLIFGWRPYEGAIAGFSIIFAIVSFVEAVTYFSHGGSGWVPLFFLVSSLILFFYILYAPFHRFVVFDRRHGLVHLPRFCSSRQDSVRWQDADFCLVDVKGGLYIDTTHTELITVRPPWDLRGNGIPPFWRRILLESANSDDANNAPTEPAFRYIVEFMTESRVARDVLDGLINMDSYLSYTFDNDFARFRKEGGRLYSLLDPELLPSKPNWMKDGSGRWKKMGRGSRARAGWFGLWGRTDTLPPHLRGTKADLDYKNDSAAPGAGNRWFSPDQQPGGTGELVDQPLEVIEAVLSDGMPALDLFSGAKTRAKKPHADSVAPQVISASEDVGEIDSVGGGADGEAAKLIKRGVAIAVVVIFALAFGVIGGLSLQ